MNERPNSIAMIERSDIIERIKRAVGEGKRNVVLFAPGGYGKTRIAQQVNRMYGGQDRDIVFTGGDVRKQLLDLIQFRSSDDSKMLSRCAGQGQIISDDAVFAAWIYNELDSRGADWCVVFDDLSGMKPDVQSEFINRFSYYPKKDPHGLVIFTTKRYRRSKRASETNLKAIEVGTVTASAAREYLLHELPELSEDDVRKIIKATGSIALPLRMAVVSVPRIAAMSRSKSIHESVQTFCKQVGRNMAQKDEIYDNNLYSATKFTTDCILSEDIGLSAYKLMMYCAMTEPRGILDAARFIEMLGFEPCGEEQSLLEDWLIFESPGISMHPTTQDILLRIDEARDFEEFLKRLIKTANAFVDMFYGDKDDVIRIWYEDNTDTGLDNDNELGTALRLSSLLSDAAEKCSEYGDKYITRYRSICILRYKICYGIAYYFWHRKTKYYEQERFYSEAYQAACDFLSNPGKNSEENAKMLFCKAAQLSYRGVALRQLDRNAEAVRCFSEALAIYDDLPDYERDEDWNKMAINAHYNRGLARSDSGNTDEVRADYEASIEIAEENGIIPFTAYRCMGIYYRDIGSYDDAVKMFNRSIETNGEQSPMDNRARCYSNLGLLYAMCVDYFKARDNCTEAIRLHLSRGSAAAATPYLNKEWSLRMFGAFDDAKECIVEAARLLLGTEEESPANAIETILNGCTDAVDLMRSDWHWKNIECMFLCTHSVRFLLACYQRKERDVNAEQLLDIAFEIREHAFTKLRASLLNLASGTEGWNAENEARIKTLTRGMKYNKLSCAVLMLTSSEYYSACGELTKALAFAYAALYLYEGYNYTYGVGESKHHIEQLKTLLLTESK